jgi:hypothetical protein
MELLRRGYLVRVGKSNVNEIDRGRNGIKNINIRDFLLMEHYS